jgi:Arylsulfotransferase (ASST)
VTPQRLRTALLAALAALAACTAATPAPASARARSAQSTRHAQAARRTRAAPRTPSAPRCVPGTLNRSALLPGTPIAVSPLPGSYDASPRTQISLLGAPAGAIGGLRVSGSQSGSHAGRVRGYSQGDGASFVPSVPFRSGETVAVRGVLRSGSRRQRFQFSFVVASRDAVGYPAPPLHTLRYPHEMQHFRSRPDLLPPALAVSARSAQAEAGYIFTAPYGGPGPSGPMIFDESGQLVWFQPLRGGSEAANLQVQRYNGKPVLTWWQGFIPQQGFGQGEDVILDSSYRQIGRIHAGNGYKADLHDLQLSEAGTALITVFDPLQCNLSAIGGPSAGAVTDSIFQELDLRTGLVRREWHSLDHVPLALSYSSPRTASAVWPFDYFHINSIDQQAGGTTLISARNTWAVYMLDTLSGRVLSVIGGRHSTVKLAAGVATAFQHDASARADGRIAIFDNGASPRIHSQSRAIVVSIDPRANTASLVAQYEHTPALSSASQGNVQTLANGYLFVGWGAAPYFSEFTAAGALLFDAHLHGSYQSYRGYREAWTGAPDHAPAIAAQAAGPGSPVTVYASWNGDTRTASWQLLAGPAPNQLAPVAAAPRSGFETAITAPGPERYVAAQALDATGALLGVSPAIGG